MGRNRGPLWVKNRSCAIIGILSLLIFFSYISMRVNANEVFSKDDLPFGISYDTWIDKWWNWWVGVNKTEVIPQEGGCLMNVSDKMVMLMETADTTSPPTQKCNISHTQGIMMPLWAAWCSLGGDEKNIKNPAVNLSQQLTQCAKEVYNLGNIYSEVKVDGNPVAKLQVRNSMISGTLDSKITTLANVSEIFTKGFNITIPPDSHKPDYQPGTWPAGSQGYWVILKPLPQGEHTVYYNVRVNPTGGLGTSCGDCNKADIYYNFHVQ